jgi:hypothetical protein
MQTISHQKPICNEDLDFSELSSSHNRREYLQSVAARNFCIVSQKCFEARNIFPFEMFAWTTELSGMDIFVPFTENLQFLRTFSYHDDLVRCANQILNEIRLADESLFDFRSEEMRFLNVPFKNIELTLLRYEFSKTTSGAILAQSVSSLIM